MSTDFASQIEMLLEGRRARAREVTREIQGWEDVTRAVEDLISKGRVAVEDASLDPELTDAIRAARLEELSTYALDSLAALTGLRHRLERDTVNIGVSGRARVGKSTLLQRISGLSDREIPTGSGLPVTAVRSRIFHVLGDGGACVRFHDEQSFLSEVVGPYIDQLGFGAAPTSLTAFAMADLSQAPDGERHEDESLRRRLREIQSAIPSFNRLLTGAEQRFALAELRPFVAYPAPDESDNRPYLAVRQVRIECAFPRDDVGRVALLDLPGLGEISPGAERRHVRDLREEVDLVVLVKRPVEGLAYWDQTDQRGFGLLEEASAPASPSDFVVLLVNAAEGDSEHLRLTLVKQFQDEVVRDRPFTLLQGDVSSPAVVDEAVLTPVLEHLLRRLPEMDAKLHAEINAHCSGRRHDLGTRLETLREAIRVPLGGSVQEELYTAATLLRQELARDLQMVVTDLRRRVSESVEDSAYVEAVSAAYGSVKEWIDSGFGLGRQEWIDAGLAAMRVDVGSGPFATRQLNAIRVEISQRFTAIDSYFNAEVAALWGAIADSLRLLFGERLVPFADEPREALLALQNNLLNAEEPCPVLAQAITELLSVRLDYRAQLHPRVREQADLLMPTYRDPDTQELRATVVAEPTEVGAATLFRDLAQLAEQVAHRTRQALFAEAVLPARVLFAAAEQFEDSAIRSSAAEGEYRSVSRSFRDDIWPGRFSSRQSAALKVREVVRGVETVASRLASTEARA